MMKTSLLTLASAGIVASLVALPMAGLAQDETEAPAAPQGAPAPAPSAPVGPPNTGRALYESIVKIECASLVPDYRSPWNAGAQTSGTGTGFLIGENKFLTNAHVVSNSIQLLIKKYGDPEKYSARILHIAHDCDLALLELDDPAPFRDVKSLNIGTIPKLESTVTVIGYPMGGRRLSTTRGVVSRIDFQPYSHSGADLHLTAQIDAAINPGNSGGPVMQDGNVVGVAFQGIPSAMATSVGYMIPPPVIRRFLKDVEDGIYDRYVDLALANFELINPAHRRALGLPNDSIGTLVSSVVSGGTCDGILHNGDVLLEIDGLTVASNGYVKLNGEDVDMNEIVERKFRGDKVQLKVWRDKREMAIEVELKPFNPYLMQATAYDVKPRFVLFAGLVFQPLDRNLLTAHSITDMQARYNYNYYAEDEIYKVRPDVVVMTTVLPDAVNSNWQGMVHEVLDKINGKKIGTMQDVYDALNPEEIPEFFVLEFDGKGLPVVMEGKLVKDAQERVKKNYNIGLDHYLGEEEDVID